MIYRWSAPIRLPSAANLREYWAARAKRAKAYRMLGRFSTEQACRPMRDGETATITLTRVAPRPLDSDNCASAFKAVRDGIADALRVDDGSPRLEWRYGQERGPWGIRAEIEIR